MLPNGKVLTIDVELAENPGTRNTEIYDPATDKWTSAGKTAIGNRLTDSKYNETGAAILRPDGTVYAIGSTGTTAIYNSNTGVWSTGPKLPISPLGYQCTQQDAPVALLRNGNVLLACSGGVGVDSTGYQTGPTYWYEFDYLTSTYHLQPSITNYVQAYLYNMLVLPTGELLQTTFYSSVYIYTPGDSSFSDSLRPVISSPASPLSLLKGQKNIKISGKYFNGFSQGSGYGDDYQGSTNFPLVRITITSTKHVFYCRTHGHSSMAVQNPNTVYTYFDVPSNIESGAGTLEVVANGIPSLPFSVTVG